MALLLVARHGETTWNRDRRYQGQTDIPLNDVGRAQAHDLATDVERAWHARLSEPTRLLVVSSDLVRARDTAKAVASRFGAVVRVRRDLRERGMGVAEGRTWDELSRTEHAAAATAYKSHRDRDALPGSEPILAFRARVLSAARAIAAEADARAEHGLAIVVTHGGALHQLLEEALGRDKKFMIDNAALYRFRVDGERITRDLDPEGDQPSEVEMPADGAVS
jgi:probable phosphoglycerate mutase